MFDAVARLNAALEGRYAIERDLGEGGMATVYLADDLKHERKVALKVLKPELAALVGGERFLGEIKTTANLQHPHILPLFDSGEADGFVFYVMPFVEGESLRDRLDREKQLGVKDSVAITRKVADALDYAHERGVVHRDIKPGNILLSERGEPLVADFGIALAVAHAGAGRITETGLSLGTPHYMSPEQATGDRDVDPRSDVFALACVLYEMLAGEPPFSAPTAQAVLVRILTTDAPSITSERRTVPPNVAAALAQALEKLPADRFTSAAEFATALGDESFTYQARPGTPITAPTAEPTTVSTPVATARPWLLDPRTLFATVAIALAAWGWLRPAPFSGPAVLSLDVGELVPNGDIVISPDGMMFAMPATPPDGESSIYVRRLDDPDFRLIPGTESGTQPAFSPDSEWLVYRSNVRNALLKVAISGGGALTLVASDSIAPYNPHWGQNGTIIFSGPTGVFRMPDTGEGQPTLVSLRGGRNPHVLPDGSGALLGAGGSIRFVDFATDSARQIIEEGTNPVYIETGHILYAHPSGGLFVVPFDLARHEVTGPPVPVRDHVASSRALVGYSVSGNGTLVFREGEASGGTLDAELVWVTRAGNAAPVDPGWRFDPGIDDHGWRLSPDGERVALTRVVDGNTDIWIKQLPDGPLERLTFDDDFETYPVWSPDGQYVTYSRFNSANNADPWRRRADGTGEPERMLTDERSLAQGRWSADGEWMVFRTYSTGGGATIGTRDIVGFRPGVDSVTIPLVATAEFAEMEPALSPDGRWLAYSSDLTGRQEVYVRPFPSVDSRVPISIDGGRSPLWANSGSELFFVDAGRSLIAAQVETDPGFRVLQRETLFSLGQEYLVGGNDGGDDFYDIALDDQSFLMARLFRGATPSSDEGPRFIVVLNWFEELRQRMGN